MLSALRLSVGRRFIVCCSIYVVGHAFFFAIRGIDVSFSKISVTACRFSSSLGVSSRAAHVENVLGSSLVLMGTCHTPPPFASKEESHFQ